MLFLVPLLKPSIVLWVRSKVSKVWWLRWLLKEFKVYCTTTAPLYCDNLAAKHIANKPVLQECAKHVEMDCCFVRERFESKEILPLHIGSKQHIANILTKALGVN